MRLSLFSTLLALALVWAFASFHRTALDQCLSTNTLETCRSILR